MLGGGGGGGVLFGSPNHEQPQKRPSWIGLMDPLKEINRLRREINRLLSREMYLI